MYVGTEEKPTDISRIIKLNQTIDELSREIAGLRNSARHDVMRCKLRRQKRELRRLNRKIGILWAFIKALKVEDELPSKAEAMN